MTIKIKVKKSEIQKRKYKSRYEMADFTAEESGLPLDIWIDSVGCKHNPPHHTPRVKIGNSFLGLLPVSIHPTRLIVTNNHYQESDINKVLKFIEINQDIFLLHWNKALTDKEALNRLQERADNRKIR